LALPVAHQVLALCFLLLGDQTVLQEQVALVALELR
jgi:hypothetical protein